MNLFDVYPLFDITPVKAEGSYIWDDKGNRYLDLYGGHAVISIGHKHPHYVKKLTDQLNGIAFYSNAVKMPMQAELAEKLGRLSGYEDYSLFLCNSGAEANENALKLASFHNGRKKIIAFSKSFHGRTSLAVAATDDASIVAPVNQTENITILPFNDMEAAGQHITDEVCAVIIEGIQGVGGVQIPTTEFFQHLSALCEQTGAILILDEVQSGYGRSGKFFAHQHAGIKPHLITVAKGMGNGFPVAGVLINPSFKAKYSMLGTTFGGNYLACAAAIAVLDVIEEENLVQQAAETGEYIVNALKNHPAVKEVRSLGLMIGVELHSPCAPVRNGLLFKHRIFTGSSSDKNTLRILPALNLSKSDADVFIAAFNQVLPNTLSQP
ncbi:MAG: aminotransferase class III-fold pyridoxal phosphate-dependent enzyme [Bacteroidetes bacterium]|nr:MAG: aminotransferase class III-fold pyridoxal phosphate-dependent enzyme [Bacteroidota bacterium]